MADNLTCDAEGSEGGPDHSRRLHVPGPASGLIIGRGSGLRRRSLATRDKRMAVAASRPPGPGL